MRKGQRPFSWKKNPSDRDPLTVWGNHSLFRIIIIFLSRVQDARGVCPCSENKGHTCLMSWWRIILSAPCNSQVSCMKAGYPSWAGSAKRLWVVRLGHRTLIGWLDSARVFDHWGLLPHYARVSESTWMMGWQDGMEGGGTHGSNELLPSWTLLWRDQVLCTANSSWHCPWLAERAA